MSRMDVNALKEIPGYKPIVKIVLQTQIQLLLEQLSDHTGGESIVMTASVNDGSLTHYGSAAGRGFLEDQDELKSKFLAYCMKSHLLSQSMGVGKRATDQTHFESSRLAKRQRIHGLPHLEETIADNQSDRSFTAEPIIDNQSHLLLRDTRTCFMPDVSMPVSLPSSIDLNHTQTSHSDNVPFLEARSETFSDSGVGSEVTLSGGGHSVAGPQNLAHDTGRLQHAATHVADEEIVGKNGGDSRNKDELTPFDDRNAVADGERLAQLLAEDEEMSADSSDNYFEEDTEDKDDDPIERISIGSSGHGTLEIKLEKVEGDHGIEKTDIESDDDVMIIEIDTDKKTNPKDSVDKENQENVPRKDCEDKSVKDQIGKCLAEQKKVMHLSSSLNAKGSNPTLVPSKQSNASKPLIKKSNTVERGYLQDMSRQEALKTSVSLLNKPLDMALLGKKRESKSKSPIRASISSNTKLKDDKKNKNDIDEGTSDLTSVKVKTEAPWSVKAGEIDLRFTDSGRIRFDSGKCFYSEDEKKVILRYAHKHSVDAASKKYLVPMATVKYWIKHNIAMDGNKQKYSEEQRTRILSFASKYGLVAAASNFNVPFNTIKFWHWSNDKKKSIEEKVKCKKSRSKYTEEERARITQYAIENGKVAACRRYKVPFGTVSVWVSFKKEKDKSRAKGPAMLKRPGPVPRKKMKKRYGIGTEKKIVEWIKEKHKKKEHISGKMVRSYCLSLVKDELPKFKATIGWLNTFLTRNNLKNHVSDIFKDSEQAVKGTHKTSEEVSLDKDSLPSEGNKASEVKDVKKGKKRRKFTEVQKASILRYATVRSVRAACLFYKVQPCQLYAWRATKALTKDSKVTGKLNTGPKSGEASNKDTSHNDAGTDNADNLSIGTESSESDLVEREEENNMSEPDNTQDDDINSNDMSSHDNVETTRVDDPMIEPNPNPKLIKRKGNHKGRTVAYGEKIDFEIFWWIIQQGKQGKEVSGNMIRAHALSVVKQKRPDLDFKASDSWMKSFLRRHSLELHFEKDDL